MKIHVASLILAFLLPVCGYAQTASPRDELRQLTEQLQRAPNDNALRERIVRLGAEIKPAPAIPEEANRSFVRGNVFQKEAKDASGYELAISAYRDALRVAPWWGDAYFNLAVVLESAGKFNEAMASIKLFMASVPGGSAEAREAQNRIYAIEAKSEMASRQAKADAQKAENSPKAKATRQHEKDEALIRSLNGAKFVQRMHGSTFIMDFILEIRGQDVHMYQVLVENRSRDTWDGLQRAGDRKTGAVSRLIGRRFNVGGDTHYFSEVTEDGSEIGLFEHRQGKEPVQILKPYLRQR